MQIMPPYAWRIVERNFRAPGLPVRKHLAFCGNDGSAAVSSQNFRVFAAENILDGAPQHWIADRRITKIAILRENRDLRTAQRGFIARKARPQQIQFPRLRTDLVLKLAIFVFEFFQFSVSRPGHVAHHERYFVVVQRPTRSGATGDGIAQSDPPYEDVHRISCQRRGSLCASLPGQSQNIDQQWQPDSTPQGRNLLPRKIAHGEVRSPRAFRQQLRGRISARRPKPQPHQLARRSRLLALRSKNRAWLSTADTVEG